MKMMKSEERLEIDKDLNFIDQYYSIFLVSFSNYCLNNAMTFLLKLGRFFRLKIWS